jgi:hypothetical protein
MEPYSLVRPSLRTVGSDAGHTSAAECEAHRASTSHGRHIPRSAICCQRPIYLQPRVQRIRLTDGTADIWPLTGYFSSNFR